MQQIVSRKEALAKGLSHYYTGKACKHGHVSKRITVNATCFECAIIKNKEFAKNNPEVMKQRDAAKYAKNKDHIKARVSRNYYKNREQVLERIRRDRVLNPEKYKTYRNNRLDDIKEYRRKNATLINSFTAKRRAAKLQRTPSWANFESIKEFYVQSKQMTESIGVRHVVDHVIPLQGKYVCGLHVHTNLQVLTFDENSRKNNKHESDDFQP